ncbi:MAG: CsgG/HfaB family protein [Candidatus Cloacimonetes bacterium]|nr:CsgG/HfaB family protein [Candidatus Cloacimonadota bacterium]
MTFTTCYKWLLVLGILIAMFACARNKRFQSQAESMIKQGRYESAAYFAIESLKLKPDYLKAQTSLKQAYPQAVLSRLERVNRLKESNDDYKWEKIHLEYNALNKLNKAVEALFPLINPENGLAIRFDVMDVSAEIAEASELAADLYYHKALHQSRISIDKESQQEAAKLFKKAMSFVPNYLDSAQRYQAARQKAVMRIAILPFEDISGNNRSYGALTNILSDLIISNLLQQNNALEYTEFITRDRIDVLMKEQQLGVSGMIDENSAANIGHLLGANSILTGKILQISYNKPRTVQTSITETSVVADREKDEEIEISCSITKYTKTASLQILASYTLVDVSTGKILSHNSFNPSYKFQESWGAKLGGDERALTTEQKKLISKEEILAPSASEMTNMVLEMLSTEIVEHLIGYLE